MSSDFCQHLLATLKTSTDPKLVTLRGLLAFGVSSIYESGDITATGLNDAEAKRRTDSRLDKALFLVLQDAGEERVLNTAIYNQTIVIRIVDRLSGYSNIRAVRLALLDYMRQPYGAEVPSGYGQVGLEYVGRTGHQYDRAANVEFEAITFKVHVDFPDD